MYVLLCCCVQDKYKQLEVYLSTYFSVAEGINTTNSNKILWASSGTLFICLSEHAAVGQLPKRDGQQSGFVILT